MLMPDAPGPAIGYSIIAGNEAIVPGHAAMRFAVTVMAGTVAVDLPSGGIKAGCLVREDQHDRLAGKGWMFHENTDAKIRYP
jgi:hypothetical protein